jgi:ADP-ribosylation factor related protein 1
MFSLLSGFYEYIFSKPVLKVLMVGLDGAGKTTLLEHIKSIEG